MQRLPDPDVVILAHPIPPELADERDIARLLTRAAHAARMLTGGAGFGADATTVEQDIADLLVRSVARCLLNPEISLAAAATPFSGQPGSFPDWSENDTALLARYRSRRTPPNGAV